MKTAELTGAQLDYWVAKALGFAGRDLLEVGETGGWHLPCDISTLYGGSGTNQVWFSVWRPSTQWSQGGPIIEREGITVVRMFMYLESGDTPPQAWYAWVLDAQEGAGSYFDVRPYDAAGAGPTYLTAAMRAYVASKFGEEVADE